MKNIFKDKDILLLNLFYYILFLKIVHYIEINSLY